MAKNNLQAVSGIVAAKRKRRSGARMGLDLGKRSIGPATGDNTRIVPVNPQRDAEGMTHRPKHPLLPGRKYGAGGNVVADTHGGRVTHRSGQLTNRAGAFQGYKKPQKKQMVMRYLSGNR